MKLKIIINSLLIIFVLHLLLENIDFNVQIGDQSYENMLNNNITKVKKNKTLQFLTGDDDIDLNTNHNMKENLLNYVKKVSVQPSNMFETDNNTPNFNSNVQNIEKKYKHYDNLHQLPQADYKSISNVSNKQEVSNDTVSSVNWKYNNELPMNGGDMNGIFGYDSLDSNFATIGSESNSCSPTGCNPNTDDLRMGMGNPNNLE